MRFNGLRFGSHSSRMAGYYHRRKGWDPRKLTALFRAGRLLGGKIGPVQEELVGSWLMSECGPRSREVERFQRLLKDQDERRRDSMAAQMYCMLLLSGKKLDELPPRLLRSPVGRRLKILDRLEAWRLWAGGPVNSGMETLNRLLGVLKTKAGM